MIIDPARLAAALPGYELRAKLGEGAYGLVLAGQHRRLGRDVAVKILSVGDSDAAARFAAEARTLAKLDHPHIVRVYDYHEDGELFLIIMELLAGGPLTRRRKTGISPEGACAVGLAAAAALSHAHARGVLHRDIKSDNMIFDAAGLLKVTDFGIAKVIEGSEATASAILGTPAHMAPEQILGGRLGPATDLYALGVVLYHLLTGAPPFDPKQPEILQRHLNVAPIPPAGVPAALADVIMRSLAKDPAERQPSAHAFALDLAHAASHVYGRQWTTRSGILLHLDEDIRQAAAPPPAARRTRPTPSPARPVAHGGNDLGILGTLLAAVVLGLGYVIGFVAAAAAEMPGVALLGAALAVGLGLGLGVGAGTGAAVAIPVGLVGIIVVGIMQRRP